MSFLKQEPPKPTLARKKWGPMRLIGADGVGHLGDVGLGLFAEGGDGVDGGDALGQEGVGRQLGQLAGPQVGGDDALAGHPLGIDVDDGLDGLLARGGLPPADQHPVGVLHVADGGALGQEFGVGDHVEKEALVVGVEDALHGLGGAHGQGAFFHDDFGRGGVLQDLAGRLFPVLQIGGFARALAKGLGGGVDADKDDVGLGDVAVDLGGEEEVLAPGAEDDLIQAGFVDGQSIGLPGGDLFGVDVDDDDAVLGAVLGDDGHGRAADVAGADA